MSGRTTHGTRGAGRVRRLGRGVDAIRILLFAQVIAVITLVGRGYAGEAPHLLAVLKGERADYQWDAMPTGGGRSMASAGDVDGDGLVDFIVGDARPGPLPGQRRCHVYFGKCPLDTFPDLVFLQPESEGPQLDCHFGAVVDGGRDINGDGFDDMVITSPAWHMDTGKLYIYFGGSDVGELPDWDAPASGSSWMNNGVTGSLRGRVIADLNHDGFGEYACVAAPWWGYGGVYVYLGGTTFDAVHDLAFEGPPYPDPPTLASDLAFGDLNADGHTDLVIATYAGGGSAEAELVWVYLGEAVPDTVVDIRLTAVGQAEGVWVGDVNGDGFDDVAVYHVASNGNVGVALALGADQMDGALDLFLPITPPEYVWSLDGGDLNLDGYADLIISVGQSNLGGPSAHKVLIYFGGDPMDSNPDVVMEGPPGLGEIVTWIGDMTGDGWPEFAVSNPEADGGRGEIYIYTMGPVSAVASEVARALTLRIAPNPAAEYALVSFFLSRPERIRLGAYDAGGRLTGLLCDWFFGRGSHSVRWSTHDLPAGVYVIHVESEAGETSQPVVLR